MDMMLNRIIKYILEVILGQPSIPSHIVVKRKYLWGKK